MNKKKHITKRINEIKAEICGLGTMRPGSLSIQKRSWGGEYLQLSYTHRGRGYTQYVQDVDRQKIEEQLANYKKYRELSKELVDLSIELAKLEVPKKKRGKSS